MLVPRPGSHSTCPAEELYIMALGLPRAGGPYLPGVFDERARYTGRSVVAVRAVEVAIGPHGKSTQVVDYVMANDAGKWRLVKRQPILVGD